MKPQTPLTKCTAGLTELWFFIATDKNICTLIISFFSFSDQTNRQFRKKRPMFYFILLLGTKTHTIKVSFKADDDSAIIGDDQMKARLDTILIEVEPKKSQNDQ
jgi:hypothetical protein